MSFFAVLIISAIGPQQLQHVCYTRSQQSPGLSPIPVCEEYITMPCRTKAELNQTLQIFLINSPCLFLYRKSHSWPWGKIHDSKTVVTVGQVQKYQEIISIHLWQKILKKQEFHQVSFKNA